MFSFQSFDVFLNKYSYFFVQLKLQLVLVGFWRKNYYCFFQKQDNFVIVIDSWRTDEITRTVTSARKPKKASTGKNLGSPQGIFEKKIILYGKSDEITRFDVLLELALIADGFKTLILLIAVNPTCKLTDFKHTFRSSLKRSEGSDFDPKQPSMTLKIYKQYLFQNFLSSHVQTK